MSATNQSNNLVTPLLLALPSAPSNGGPLEGAPAKVGAWVWQPKIDDWRGVVHAPTLRVWNQYGVQSTVAAQGKINDALEELRHLVLVQRGGWREGFEWFDVGIMENRHDMMRGAIVVFDVMDTQMPHVARREILARMFPVLPMASELLANGNVEGGVYLINEWGATDHLALWKLLKAENEYIGRKFYEGLVAKRQDATYPLAYRAKAKTPVWVKHRFDQ